MFTSVPERLLRKCRARGSGPAVRAFHGAGVNKLTLDFGFGKVSVLQEIAKAKKRSAEARAVMQIGIVICGADGDFHATEGAVVPDARFALRLPPHEFDLIEPGGVGGADLPDSRPGPGRHSLKGAPAAA
jgi:hypothetical protein